MFAQQQHVTSIVATLTRARLIAGALIWSPLRLRVPGSR